MIIVGARRDGIMRFRARLPQDTATLLLSASFVIALVALAVASHDEAARHVDALSAVAAVCLLAIYARVAVGAICARTSPREAAHEARRPAPRCRSRCRWCCSRSRAPAPRSPRTGSSARSSRRSRRSASRRRSPAS